MKVNYLEDLNESQRAAVEWIDGPSLVIAGAGSGKTRVLTYKIVHLLESGYAPWEILALTFTNKAAREMKERIVKLVGPKRALHLWMGTFHSMFLRILRQEAESIGFTSNLTIYDASDSKSLIKNIIREMGLDDKTYKPSAIAGRISRAKNALLFPKDYMAEPEIYENDRLSKVSLTGKIYETYMQRLHNANAMDFDDILLYVHHLFDIRPEICTNYANHFRYILVDEYQDTNCAQSAIVWQLAHEHQHVCVVGDDAQSIYSFRGANIDNILNFSKQYPDAKLFKLQQNYRSTQTIVNAANSVILNNRGQIRKEVYSENEPGDRLKLSQAYSDMEEGEIVVRQIAFLHQDKNVGYDDIAILYRTNAQSRIFEEVLRKRTIPYRIYGGLSFYQRREIKDAIAYFRLIVNPADEEAFRRIINYPSRSIGETTLNKITEMAHDHLVSLWDVCAYPDEYKLTVNKGTAKKISGFVEVIKPFLEDVNRVDAFNLGERIIRESGMASEIFNDKTPEGISRQENVTELLNAIQSFVEQQKEEGNEEAICLADYLSQVSLLSDTDQKDDGEPKVTLMTIHAAKGLEFMGVFIVGLEDGLFPNASATYSPREMEEERRLFYVALTRARKFCFLSYSKSRYHYGKMDFCNPSSFLREIDAELLDKNTPMEDCKEDRFSSHKAYTSRSRIMAHTSTGTTQMNADLKRMNVEPQEETRTTRVGGKTVSVGQTIEHERFGIGTVLRIEGQGESSKAAVRFQNLGEKQLLLKFARFKVLK